MDNFKLIMESNIELIDENPIRVRVLSI